MYPTLTYETQKPYMHIAYSMHLNLYGTHLAAMVIWKSVFCFVFGNTYVPSVKDFVRTILFSKYFLLFLHRVYMNFENLFNGDKLLGDTTNLFLNENWEDVINELKPALRDAIGAIAGNVIKSVFSKFPYSNYWLDDNASSPEA